MGRGELSQNCADVGGFLLSLRASGGLQVFADDGEDGEMAIICDGLC